MNVNLQSVLLVACCWFSFLTAQRTPSITYISEEQAVNLGSTVELACSVQYATGLYPVQWVKLGKDSKNNYILSTDTSLVVKESRFAALYDGASSTYTVLIKDVQEGDSGEYQCEVILSITNKLVAITQLTVLQSPIITDNSTQAIVAKEGDFVIMECFATGNPQPTIVWRRENNALLPTGGSTYNGNVIKIHTVNKEDRGTYYCFADNGVGKGDRRNINLEIEFPPIIIAPREKIGQALHYDVDLECHIEAYPPPQIFWTKDSYVIPNNRNYKISNFETNDEFTDSTLRIITLREKQYGDYMCSAANKLGKAEATIHLYETKSPVCPPACGGHQASSAITCNFYSVFLITFSFICTILR